MWLMMKEYCRISRSGSRVFTRFNSPTTLSIRPTWHTAQRWCLAQKGECGGRVMIMQNTLTEPHPRRWTKAEYYQLGDLGFFQGQKVELLAGEIIIQYPDPDRTGLPYRGCGPQPRLWTKAEYYRLGDLGF